MDSKKSLSVNDPNSFSNPEHVRVEHIHLTWDVNFAKRIISGTAEYQLLKSSSNAKEVILDTHSLVIKSVRDSTGADLDFKLGDSFLTFGKPLTIQLPSPTLEDLKSTIRIEYESDPTAEALQWMEPEQTHGKQYPYVFSQCQAIHARSLLPCQDTPFVKAAYTAQVRAPKDLVVLMSAIQSDEPKIDGDSRIHSFEQKVPIPSYLIAIVAGNLESVELGPRSRVWSEKAFLELAAIDFAETEKMLQCAETLCGKYVWQRYDMLVLPPSFPYGGMENPNITFLTPTLLTGDKSLANVVAHEITHSWTGNLVTNTNFEHFWLNEGFTRFIERKIVGVLHGEKMRQFECHLGWSDLLDAVKALGATNPLTQLVVDLKGVDPEDAFSRIPYEKGSTFLYYLEETVGGPCVFEPFLRDYIAEYAYKSIDTPVFKNFFNNYFTKLGKEQEISKIDWEKWLYSPGLPVVKPNYDTTLLNACTDLKNRWDSWSPELEDSPFSKKDFADFHPNQIVEFLNQLVLSDSLFSIAKAEAMEKAYDFGNSSNAEYVFRWIRLICKAEWFEKLPLALDFVTKNGRMKFLQPIYRDLYKWEKARNLAIATFQKNRPTMMHGSVFVTEKILGLR